MEKRHVDEVYEWHFQDFGKSTGRTSGKDLESELMNDRLAMEARMDEVESGFLRRVEKQSS
jgi:hypothetical protein